MISAEFLDTFRQITGVHISGLIALLGTAFNIINITVFVKIGFSDNTNISLLALAVSDIGVSLPILLLSLTNLPLLSSLMQALMIFLNTILGSIQIMFCRISGLLTAYLALERFLCVAWPLRVRTVITPRLTIGVTSGIFMLMTSCNVPMFLTQHIVLRFEPLLNVTVYGSLMDPKDNYLKDITITIQVVAQMTSFAVVILSTLGLIQSLRQSVQWRYSTSSAGLPPRESGKEKWLVKMVILISSVFIVCALPTVVGNLAMVFVNDFSIRGSHRDLFLMMGMIVMVLNCINSMINIFVYVKMLNCINSMINIFVYAKMLNCINSMINIFVYAKMLNCINSMINIFVYAKMSSRFREKLLVLLKRCS